jgi:hypothetical protein
MSVRKVDIAQLPSQARVCDILPTIHYETWLAGRTHMLVKCTNNMTMYVLIRMLKAQGLYSTYTNHILGLTIGEFWLIDFIAACLAFILAWMLSVLAGR